MGPFPPADRPGPGGLKGRGTLGEPGRSRRYAPRVRESDALPVTQAEREPAALSGSRRRAPTTARDRRSLSPLARQRRARTPQGATRPRSVVRKTRMRLSSVREIEDFPLATRILRILAPSRESIALSTDSESRAARRRSRLEPCERAGGPRAEAETAEGFQLFLLTLLLGTAYLNTTQ